MKYLNQAIWYAGGKGQNILVQKIMDVHLPNYMEDLNKSLAQKPSFKFICGNELTIYDFTVAGYFHNVFLNPKAEFADGWQKTMKRHCPKRVQKYLSNFAKEMKSYLDRRQASLY